MPHLKVTLLGHFTASLDDAPVETFAYDKVRALLAYLTVEAATPHSREHVADLLWPGYPERSARQNLSQALSTLRGALGDRDNDPPFLLADYRELQFNPASDLWLDVDALIAHLNAVQTHTHPSLSECAPCIAHLEAAADLYRGDFLADLLVDDSAPFEEWALLKRESLRRQMLDALEQLAEGHLQHGDAAAALKYARRQLELDAWREPAHRQVMRALVLRGQRTAAVAHYEECRHALATGLGVEPEAATLELAHMLKSNTLPDGTRIFADAASGKADLVGRAVGSYLIVEHLGQGGMAHVYKAYHTRLARYVALKFIRSELLEPAALRAFEKEAKTLASLNHPNVIQVYDFGEIEDAARQPYLVLEFVTGQSLAEWLPKGEALPLEQVWPILRQVSAALDYAHTHGVIHRDIKPGNVMLTPDGHALLGDFGISKLLHSGDDAAHTVAATGTPAYMAPEQVDHSLGPIGPATDVYALGVVAYEMLTGRRPFEADTVIAEMVRRVQADPTPPRQYVAGLPIAVEQVLLKTLAWDPRERYNQASAFTQALALAAPEALSGSVESWWPHLTGELAPAPGDPPFKGLQYFDVTDADLFFGREALTTRLVRQITPVAPHDQRAGRAHFLAVIGASGSGKSSLVRAGLVATLQRSVVSPDVPSYTAHILTPTAHPLEALALALTRDSESLTAATSLIDDLTRDPRSLRLYFQKQNQRMSESANRRISKSANAEHPASSNQQPATSNPQPTTHNPQLLIIDQFEEIFTLCRAPAEREAFIANLLNAAQGDGADVFVVITLRADFYEHCAHYPDLREAVSQRQVYIGPMTADGLRHAIEEPAQRAGWTFEPGLVDLLLRDIGAGDGQQPEPGALPLLSHALLETWKRRRGRTLTLGGYAEAGGVRGAIAKTAEAVYQQLDAEQQTIARNLFMRLTELGEGTQDTRRRVTLTELRAQHAGAEVVDGVLARLADARLVTTERETAQVAHEALIREWPTLRGWLEADREGLHLHRHLTEASQAWAQLERDPGELYRGARLAQAVEWASVHATALNALEQEFLAASQAEAERAEAEREAQRQRELDAARKLAETEKARAEESRFAARKLRGRARALAFAALGILVVALLAALQWNQARLTAQENATLADANANIAATAVAVSELEAAQRAAAETARSAEEAARIEAEAARLEADVQRITAETARDEAQQQTRRALAAKLAALATAAVDDEYGLALLLSAQAYNTLDIPQTRGSMLTVLEHQPALRWMLPYDGAAQGLDISRDGRLLAASGKSVSSWVGTLSLWDMATGQPIVSAERFMDDSLEHVEFSPDGETLAVIGCRTRGEDKYCTQAEIVLWDVTQSEVRWRTTAHTAWPHCVTFNPDGTILASSAEESTVWLWDAATGRAIQQLDTEAAWVMSLAFSPDGAILAAGTCMAKDETQICARSDVLLWDTASGELRAQWPSQTGDILSVAFSPDGALLAAGGCATFGDSCTQGETVLWNVETGERHGQALGGHTDFVWGVAFSPDGRLLATGAWDKLLRLWDAATGEPVAEPVVTHNRIKKVAFSPDGKTLVSAGEGTAIRLWDVAKLQETMPRHIDTILVRAAPMGALALNPDQTIAATSTWFTGEILRWDLATGAPVGAPIPAHAGPIAALSFSSDGKLLASGGYDTIVRLWDAETGQPVGEPMTGHTSLVFSTKFNPSGDILISTSDDGTVRLWDVATGEPLGPHQGVLDKLSGVIYGTAFSPDGSQLAFGNASAEPRVRILDWRQAPAAAQVITEWPTDAGITGVTFSPDGRRLAVTSGIPHYAVALWDIETGQRIGAPMVGHKYGPWRPAFSPDGTMLASAGLDSALRLWDVATGEPIGPSLTTHPQYMTGAYLGLAFSDDGRTLYTASADGTLRAWPVTPDAWRDEVCAVAGRNLTQAEWARYMPDMPYEKTCPQWPAGE